MISENTKTKIKSDNPDRAREKKKNKTYMPSDNTTCLRTRLVRINTITGFLDNIPYIAWEKMK